MSEFIAYDKKGKEQIFNKSKIAFMGTDGELKEFSEGSGELNLQDKTITENGEYTADEGFDGLGIVNVLVGGGNSNFKYTEKVVTIKGSINERVSANFGFKPDFLVMYPNDSVTHSGKYVVYIGSSIKFADVFGKSKGCAIVGVGSSSAFTRHSGSDLNSTSSNAQLYGADETGFNLGDNYSYAAGTYKVIALGL